MTIIRRNMEVVSFGSDVVPVPNPPVKKELVLQMIRRGSLRSGQRGDHLGERMRKGVIS